MKEKKALREQILDLVREYTKAEQAGAKPYKPGMRIPYASRVYDEQERVNLVDSALTFWLTAGEYAEQFERKLAAYLDVPYAYAVNSGSSANLLAFMALTSPLLGRRALKRGDEVITVAAAFPATVAPILQAGCVPVFADIDIPSYNIDVSMLAPALSEKTKAVFLAHSLGNPFNLKAVSDFCAGNNLFLIEDNCDALGAEYDRGYGFEKTGTVGDIGTSSFYPAHHITTGEGGAVYTKNPQLAKILLSMRDWGRDCVCPSGKDDTCGHRFDGQFGTLPKGYDHKYVYSHLGYNLKMTDMQAAVGCAQIDKLPSFVQKRRENWLAIRNGIQKLSEWLILPEEEMNSKSSPFGFLVTMKENSPVSRDQMVAALESKGVQTRMFFAGNITRHPCFAELKNGADFRVCGELRNTDRLIHDTFWVGVYPGLDEPRIQAMVNAFGAVFR
ncbi:MAG: lipopolysaccharide biosynthesis protein RfbH [Gracilibacteraceae bacterium]|nr:lipopolysaccharide biosynthesis protein RfbH [Gracilibacteraceae bacterium]